jgi:hypothetical protein
MPKPTPAAEALTIIELSLQLLATVTHFLEAASMQLAEPEKGNKRRRKGRR